MTQMTTFSVTALLFAVSSTMLGAQFGAAREVIPSEALNAEARAQGRDHFNDYLLTCGESVFLWEPTTARTTGLAR